VLATAGASEGRGHLARALALAEAADEMGIATRIALSRGKPSAAELARALATGAVFTEAAELMQREGPFVVDLPDPNEVDLRRLSEATVFDDSELLGAPARVVVQPSVPVWTPSHGGSAATLLCGFAYAPLGRAVRAAIGTRTGGASWPPAVLLCFGGSDPADVTARVGRRLASDPRWRLEVVVGPDYRGTAEATGLGVIREPADLVERLVRADVAVIGAGTMKFEAAALGVPAVLVAVADDQVPVGPRFAAAGAAVWMGDGRHIDPEALAECVAAVAGDEVRRATMSRRGPEVVPGDGARRIVAETMADTGTEGAV
jgi:spore coat polysaccharide biosynthesis predicted glycosyltransferase SpsG